MMILSVLLRLSFSLNAFAEFAFVDRVKLLTENADCLRPGAWTVVIEAGALPNINKLI